MVDVARIPVEPETAMAPTQESTSVQSTSTQGDRPEWLPEKFNSPEDLSKAYAELEKKLGGAKPEETEGEPKETPEAKTDELSEAVGFDLTNFYQEFEENGNLSEESFAALEAKGLPRDVVQRYIEGSSALAEQASKDIIGSIGGETVFNEMVLWAQNNLTPAELAAYNAAVDSGDINQAKLAVQGIHNRFTQSVGSEPGVNIQGNTQGVSSGAPFRSIGEAQMAMSDPRYEMDAAYRADVEKRLLNSNIYS